MTPEEITRALASLRHDEPVPDDVARRLDDRLAELTAERAGAAERTTRREHGADAEPPASPRRRRVLWVAAAACVVALAGGQLLGDGVSVVSDGGSSSADSESAGGVAAAGGDTAVIEPGPPVALTSAGFARQARRAGARPLTEYDTGAERRTEQDRRGVTTLQVGPDTCRTPPAGPESRLLPATYDGRPAVLEIAPSRATLWACDGRRVLNESGLTP